MKKINVEINPNLEFINSILLTSRYNEMTKPFIGYGLMTEERNQYTEAIKTFFSKFQTSPIYDKIEAMIPSGFTFSRPVELMLSLGNARDFTIQYCLSDLCVQYCGGMEQISILLQLLNQFSSETKYFAFFESVKAYYDPYLQKITRHVQAYPYIDILEDIYGRRQNSYHYIPSNLMVGNFGINFRDAENM